MHPLLRRQLNRVFKGEPPSSPELRAFIEAVDAAYQGYDTDLQLLERAAALAARETEARYRALQEDIAQRQRAESAREGFFRTSPDMVAVVDQSFRFVERNDGWRRDLGYDNATLDRVSVMSLIHADDRDRVRAEAIRVQAGETSQAFEFRVKHASGAWRWLSVASCRGHDGCFYVVGRDVTEQRRMASELAQSHKLEAVGQLASGVAHEINTPVQYVGDNLDFAADGFKQVFTYLDAAHAVLAPEQRASLADLARTCELDYFRDELPSSLKAARDGVRRVAELVRALKEFAHPDAHEKSDADVNRILERTITLARGETKHVCAVTTSLEATQFVRAHEGSLSQVFLNLIVNAAHAVEEVTSREGRAAEHRISIVTRDEPGAVLVSISDTGCGIPDAIRDRIFEPFFTTKPMGKGTGQGLPLVRRVVTSHGGTLEVDSAPGRGTTFSIRLPCEARSPSGVRRAA